MSEINWKYGSVSAFQRVFGEVGKKVFVVRNNDLMWPSTRFLLRSYCLCSNNWIIPETSWLFPGARFLLPSPSVSPPPQLRNKSIGNEITHSIHFSPSSKWASLKNRRASPFGSSLIKSCSLAEVAQNHCLRLRQPSRLDSITRLYLFCETRGGTFIVSYVCFLKI